MNAHATALATDEAVLSLSAQLAELVARTPDARERLTGHRHQWLVDYVATGRHIPMNPSSVKALRLVLDELSPERVSTDASVQPLSADSNAS